jgi:hypothetical protein
MLVLRCRRPGTATSTFCRRRTSAGASSRATQSARRATAWWAGWSERSPATPTFPTSSVANRKRVPLQNRRSLIPRVEPCDLFSGGGHIRHVREPPHRVHAATEVHTSTATDRGRILVAVVATLRVSHSGVMERRRRVGALPGRGAAPEAEPRAARNACSAQHYRVLPSIT